MTLKRGKRKSLVLTVGRWRFRLVPGRFRIGFRREVAYGGQVGTLAFKVGMVSFTQTADRREDQTT